MRAAGSANRKGAKHMYSTFTREYGTRPAH